MIILTNTTDNIQAILAVSATTNQLNCIASYRDITTSTHIGGRNVTNTNNITAVNIIPAPASSTQRVADYISIYNSDTTSAKVTINYNANGTTYRLWQGTLASGEKVEYTDENGFKVINNTTGAVKQTVNQGTNTDSGIMSSVVLSSDVANSTTTLADVTALSFPMVANSTYYFKFIIPYTAALTTTGSRWTINTAASFSQLEYSSTYTLTTTTQTVNYNTALQLPASANATSMTDGNVAIIEGTILPTTSGTLIAQFASKTAASAITAKAGAVLYYQKVL